LELLNKKRLKMDLEKIGFYTLSNKRAKQASEKSNLKRCELILTDRCNFKCPYCRGLRSDLKGDLSFEIAVNTVRTWIEQGLENIRFSGGEPTLYKGIEELIRMCKLHGVKRIAISTNGASSTKRYKRLIDAGVNDVSISLDACCASVGNEMAGGINVWDKVVNNIKKISKLVYTTVGMVFTESNLKDCVKNVLFADSLGVSDIRVIPSAQYNVALNKFKDLPKGILDKYPILKYRINNINSGRHVRGIQECDSNKCPLVLDDIASAGGKHFPCIIYMREYGNPIGDINKYMRKDRLNWYKNHNTKTDPICKKNCLDVCIDYNNKYKEYHKE
jgi:MoaA/NifB/PqqE/SkfB family radical SAM enzyme